MEYKKKWEKKPVLQKCFVIIILNHIKQKFTFEEIACYKKMKVSSPMKLYFKFTEPVKLITLSVNLQMQAVFSSFILCIDTNW